MAKLGRRVGIGMLILVLPAFLYLIFISQAAREQERKESVLAKNKLSQLEKIRKELELDLDKLKDESSFFTSRQEEVKKEAELLKARLKKEQEDKEAITEQLQARLQELITLKAQLRERSRQNEGPRNDLERLERDYELLQLQLEESRTANEELKEKITALRLDIFRKEKEAVEAERAAPAISAKVLLVNKEFNFISVNLGYKHGLKKGDELLVFRGNKGLGSAFVENTYDYTLIATFSALLKESIEVGDTIKLKVE